MRGFALLILVAILVPAGLAVGGGGDDPGGGRTADGSRELQLLRLKLERAEDRVRDADGNYRAELAFAHEAKVDFINVAFGGYSYLEACDAADLLRAVDKVNTSVRRGYYQEGNERVKSLGVALTAGRNLLNDVVDCSPDHVTAPDQMVSTVRELQREHEDGEVGDASGQRGFAQKGDAILNLNRNLIASSSDQVAGGCEVPGFNRAFEALDRSIVIAELYSAEFLLDFKERDANAKQAAKRHSLKERREQLGGAISSTNKLLRVWRKCSKPLCADGIDNDDDGTSDADDIGCRSDAFGAYDADDQSEDKAELPTVVCPAAGTAATPESPAGFSMTNANAGDEVTAIALHNASSGQPIFVRDAEAATDLADGGPVSLGDAVCGPGTTTFVFWRVERTTVTWEFVFYKNDKDVAPVRSRIVGVADTR